jgi:hypothetical protein
MIKRAELEVPKSSLEIGAIVARFTDRKIIPDEQVLRRQGIAKTMLEEYIPLYRLMQHLGGITAHLAKDSNRGPDGFIQLPNGGILSVQITSAGYGKNEALGGELMAEGKPCWSGMTRTTERVNGVRRIIESGRAFTTPKARSDELVAGITKAISDKIEAYRPLTDALLVKGEVRKHDPIWKKRIMKFLRSIDSNPYGRVFVGDTAKGH